MSVLFDKLKLELAFAHLVFVVYKLMCTKNQQKVTAILCEIQNYRCRIRTEREYIMEYEDEMALIQDKMRFHVMSTAQKLKNKQELKELAECVCVCKGSIGRSERWIKRKMKSLLD